MNNLQIKGIKIGSLSPGILDVVPNTLSRRCKHSLRSHNTTGLSHEGRDIFQRYEINPTGEKKNIVLNCKKTSPFMGEVDPVGSAGLVSPLELQIPMAGDALQDRERVLDGSLSL